MKGKILIVGLFAIITLLSSCYYTFDEREIHACFSTRYEEYYVGEIIDFENCSDFADGFEWYFGDGTYSKVEYPTHSYNKPGVYEIKLTAYNNYGLRESAYLTVKILDRTPTELNILVKYFGTNDPVSNCQVTLFNNYNDWFDLKNSISSAVTGSQGIVIFSNLQSLIYYLDAYKKVNETNYYSNEKTLIKTNILEPGKVNYYDISIEYFTNSAGKKSFVIKEITKANPR